MEQHTYSYAMLSRLKNIPTLPMIIDKLLEIPSIDYSIKDIIKVIEIDQSIASKILKLSNSVFFGFSRKISSLAEAVSLMGIDTIKAIALATPIFDNESFEKFSRDNIEIRKLWLHTSVCAFLARHIWNRIGIREFDSGTVFASALFHDIGKFFFLLMYPEEYPKILLDSDAEKKNTKFYEEERLGIDHALLTSMIFDKWNFPHSLFVPIKFHHNLNNIPNIYQKVAIVINACDKLSWNTGYGFMGSCDDDQESLKEIGEQTLQDAILYLENNIEDIRGISDFIS